jgi:hypothetical protein
MIEKSETIKELAGALLVFDSECAKIGKTASNPFFKNKYAPLPEILDGIKDPLQKAGLTVKQIPTGEYGLYTIVMHASSGQWMGGESIMKPAKDDPQGNGSRITYQRRYSLGAILGLNIDEDDDGNKASINGAKPKAQPAIVLPPVPDHITPDPIILANLIMKIDYAKSTDELMQIYEAHKEWHKEKEFITALARKKQQLKNVMA